MKKSLIVTGAASLAIAALPVVGVFAADPTSQSFTDNIRVTVPTGCTMETSATSTAGDYADRSFTEEIPAGSYKEFGNSDASGSEDATISVSCNEQDNSKSWVVKATASTNGQTGADLKAALKLTSDDVYIEAGTADSGTTSAWAMMLDVTDASDVATNSYSTYTAVPATANTTVLTAPTNATGISFRPVYRVFVAPGQTPGNYDGTVVYTIEVPQS